ncbi:fungal-specific transcription factor domain-containing protein [Ephemerocybe angulata]|uniref:Fungal-specific transcription factor domain-containing protein n=1 Tax=Ephemerocybe angulata TaxID=980116 RepID=A0A8H6I0F4_9AGAR|nr:fungal-specific transcription factor domain-containing protein [Tulosesus angulatus]
MPIQGRRWSISSEESASSAFLPQSFLSSPSCDDPCADFCRSKREYLLAQIRQKDEIIESLLKQLHNPYLATPLSIASYRLATSPSDQNKGSVLAWLDRLQSSVKDSSVKGGANLFGNAREQRKESETDPDGSEPKEMVEDDEESPADDDHVLTEEKEASSLPDSHVPLGLIANLSINHSKKTKKGKDGRDGVGLSEEDLNDDNVGVANETYFLPGPATDLGMRATMIEQHSPPEILVHGLVTPEDVDKLFELFYTHVNPFISLLDPVLHTPASTFARCPFLFTVVCAIASRYHADKSEIYPIAMHFAKHSAASALTDGWKSVELCQAYILMSIYAVPARRWEEDRSWLYTGLAIRHVLLATDLNLHQTPTAKATSEKQEREQLNKARVWMTCFNLDRSTATQFGKPSTIKEDFVVRNAKDWYKKSEYNLSYDIHLCGFSELLQILSKFHDRIFSDPSSPSGLNKKIDFLSITLEHDTMLSEFHTEWSKRFEEESDSNDPGCLFRCALLPFLVAYSRLVMFSFGFQQAFQRGLERSDNIFFTKCLESAKTVIETMVTSLAETGYMKYAPDGHFVYATFASAFLLKLLRPEFSKLLEKDQENEIFALIGGLIETLSSPKIAIDDRHTPKLYARFLANLLSRHRRDGATIGRLQTQPPTMQHLSSTASKGQGASMSTFSITQNHGQGAGNSAAGFSQSMFQQKMMHQDTPIYMPEATFTSGTGQISFGTGFDSEPGDDETLAPMQALRNPAWWQDLMMPGFLWPDASPSPPQAAGAYPSTHNPPAGMAHPRSTMPGLNGTFGMFHTAQIPLH